MVFKKLYPGSPYTLRDMDLMTRRRANRWTFESQLVPPLLDRGLDVKLFAETDYSRLSPDYVRERYGEHAARVFDLDAARWGARHLTPDIYTRKALSWSEVEDYFCAGYITVLCVDRTALYHGESARFDGHSVVVLAVSGDGVVIHDPGKGPAIEVPKRDMIKAWSARGTDHAALFVKRKPESGE